LIKCKLYELRGLKLCELLLISFTVPAKNLIKPPKESVSTYATISLHMREAQRASEVELSLSGSEGEIFLTRQRHRILPSVLAESAIP
jgi:hypothetical protein